MKENKQPNKIQNARSNNKARQQQQQEETTKYTTPTNQTNKNHEQNKLTTTIINFYCHIPHAILAGFLSSTSLREHDIHS